MKTVRKLKKESKRIEIFLREYMIDLNGTAAAIRAGYTERTARITAAKLLSKANIRERLTKLIMERQKRVEVDADRVLQRFCDFAFATPQELISQWGELGIKVSDVIKALENISKHIVDIGAPAKLEKGRELLEKFKTKEIDVRDAAIEFAILGLRLPEVIKLELQKQKEPEMPLIGKVVSDDELDRSTEKEKAKALAWKEDELPKRRVNVARLEKELTGDSPKLADEEREE